MEQLGPESLTPWRVTYPSAGRDLAGCLFVPPEEGPLPALVINHGSPGIRTPRVDGTIRLAEAMNRLGYVAFFPARQGKPHETGVYAPCGTTNLDGHLFMYQGIPIWSADFQRFLNRWLGEVPDQA